MSKNLHIFNDQLGFFTNKTVAWFESIHPGDLYLNTAADCKNQISEIHYSGVTVYLKQLNCIIPETVLFHSYSYFNRNDIKKIKARFNGHNIKFIWVFWSHEYYQLPEFFSQLYQGFSRRFYLRKIISFHAEIVLKYLKGESDTPFYSGLSSFKKTFNQFDAMAALIENDYEMAMDASSAVKYEFISYISLRDFPELKTDFAKEIQDIMIGHSGSPIINHYEMVQFLSSINAPNRILIPLSYGKKSYIQRLKKKINSTISNCNITFMEAYLTKEQYYQTIESVGYFILNSFCQQALGNIFFFLCTGTKIFLRKNTSTYITLKKRSFFIYSIDDDLNKDGLKPLMPEQKRHNQQLAIAMINNDRVKNSWLKILNF